MIRKRPEQEEHQESRRINGQLLSLRHQCCAWDNKLDTRQTLWRNIQSLLKKRTRHLHRHTTQPQTIDLYWLDLTVATETVPATVVHDGSNQKSDCKTVQQQRLMFSVYLHGSRSLSNAWDDESCSSHRAPIMQLCRWTECWNLGIHGDVVDLKSTSTQESKRREPCILYVLPFAPDPMNRKTPKSF